MSPRLVDGCDKRRVETKRVRLTHTYIVARRPTEASVSKATNRKFRRKQEREWARKEGAQARLAERGVIVPERVPPTIKRFEPAKPGDTLIRLSR
jgi:hypothetical protein